VQLAPAKSRRAPHFWQKLSPATGWALQSGQTAMSGTDFSDAWTILGMAWRQVT